MLSIITPVLNGAEYIADNIREIQKLTIPFEHIVVDGGSNDDTLSIINQYSHIKLLHQKEQSGMYGAIHQGFLNSNGEYIAYVNSDDRVIASGFEKMYNRILRSDFDIVYSDSFLVYPTENKVVKHYGNRFAKFFLKHGILPFIQPSSIFSKTAYLREGGFRFDRFRICGDLDLFHRIAARRTSKFIYVGAFSSFFVVREGSLGNLNSHLVRSEKVKNHIPITTIMIRVLYKVSGLLSAIRVLSLVLM